MRTINNMIAETLNADAAAFTKNSVLSYSSASTTRCVNLLKLYNTRFVKNQIPANALTDQEFIRFASYIMGLYADRLGSISTLFNIGGKERFTPSDMLHTVLLSEFAHATKIYLLSETFNQEHVLLPQSQTVSSWQSSGLNYNFTSVSSINVKTSTGAEINAGGILGVMFDRDALGVCNLDKRVTTNYNAKAEFFNNYYKFDCGYFNDTNENFVVFFIA